MRPDPRPESGPAARSAPGLLGAHISIAGGFDLCPERGGRLGCTAIQLFVKSANQWRARPFGAAEIEAFSLGLADHGIRSAFGHGSYLPNLATPNRAMRERSVGAVEEEVRRCGLLGLPFLVVHPGAHRGAGRAAGVRFLADSINRVLERTAGTPVAIALENTAGQGTALGVGFEELAAVIDRVEDRSRMAVCMDTCHTFTSGLDISTEQGYEAALRRLDAAVGLERLAAVHLNDSKTACGSRRDRHEHIGKGRIGLTAFRLFMNDPRLAGVPKVIETPKGDRDALDRRNLTTLRNLVERSARHSAARKNAPAVQRDRISR